MRHRFVSGPHFRPLPTVVNIDITITILVTAITAGTTAPPLIYFSVVTAAHKWFFRLPSKAKKAWRKCQVLCLFNPTIWLRMIRNDNRNLKPIFTILRPDIDILRPDIDIWQRQGRRRRQGEPFVTIEIPDLSPPSCQGQVCKPLPLNSISDHNVSPFLLYLILLSHISCLSSCTTWIHFDG